MTRRCRSPRWRTASSPLSSGASSPTTGRAHRLRPLGRASARRSRGGVGRRPGVAPRVRPPGPKGTPARRRDRRPVLVGRDERAPGPRASRPQHRAADRRVGRRRRPRRCGPAPGSLAPSPRFPCSTSRLRSAVNRSPTSSTSASPATCGCTASTWHGPRTSRSTSTPTTTAASWPTSSPSGRAPTGSPSPCSSTARPEAATGPASVASTSPRRHRVLPHPGRARPRRRRPAPRPAALSRTPANACP